MGPTWNDINGIDAIKRYQNTRQISRKGKVTNGSKVNTHADVVVDSPRGTYYEADNTSGKLESKYARVFIRRKK